MFNEKSGTDDEITYGFANVENRGSWVTMETPGSCRFSGCRCARFVPKSAQDAQFCENSGHSRSSHIH